MTTEEEIREIFKKWEQLLEEGSEEYIPESNGDTFTPVYIPTPVNAGPKPITIEEYKRRQTKNRENLEKFRESTTLYTPKKRGGRKRKH